MQEKLQKLYDKYLDEFIAISKSSNNVRKYNLENILLILHRFANKQPYFYTILYELNGDFETYTMMGEEKRRGDYKNFCLNNMGRLLQDFETLASNKEKNSLISSVDAIGEDDILNKFFLSIDQDLYDLYQSLKQKENILRVTDGGSKTLFDMNTKAIYILCGKELTVENMICLVHEMGQAYRYNMKKELITSYDYDLFLRSEMTGATLELAFVKYLIENDIYGDVATEYLKAYNNGIIRDCQTVINNNLYVDNKQTSGLGEMCFLLARIVSHSFINSNMSFKEFTDYIHNNKVARILNNIDAGEISDNFNKSFCLKK